MVFSSILQNIDSIKEARKKGLQVKKYKIVLIEIKSDFAKMKAIYESSLAKLSAHECLAFSNEIDRFFQTLNKLACSPNGLTLNEQQQLEIILEKTREIRDIVKSATKKHPEINETDNQQ